MIDERWDKHAAGTGWTAGMISATAQSWSYHLKGRVELKGKLMLREKRWMRKRERQFQQLWYSSHHSDDEGGDEMKTKSGDGKRQSAGLVRVCRSQRLGRHQLASPHLPAHAEVFFVVFLFLPKAHLKLVFGSSCNSDNNVLPKGYSGYTTKAKGNTAGYWLCLANFAVRLMWEKKCLFYNYCRSIISTFLWSSSCL